MNEDCFLFHLLMSFFEENNEKEAKINITLCGYIKKVFFNLISNSKVEVY
jgi:hypothetical protein